MAVYSFVALRRSSISGNVSRFVTCIRVTLAVRLDHGEQPVGLRICDAGIAPVGSALVSAVASSDTKYHNASRRFTYRKRGGGGTYRVLCENAEH